MTHGQEMTRKALFDHCRRYPGLGVQDLLKFLYQSAFGCEHMVASPGAVAEGIRAEYEELNPQVTEIELLDGEYVRVPLGLLAEGLSPETLGYLFHASAKKEPAGRKVLLQKIEIAREMTLEGAFPFSPEAFEKAVLEWEEAGFPAIRHSEGFRETYHPAYRVIARRFIPFLPLFTELDRRLERGPVTLAIEGGSASGKSTLGQLLADCYGCNLFHMDDFFLRPEQRTPERYAEPGGNVDRERFETEVLFPLSKGEGFSYRKFDCSTMELGGRMEVAPCRLNVIEGAYSMHPDLEKYYDMGIFLQIDAELQRERILKRNGPELAERFFDEWIPMEERYFTETKASERCHMIIK